jgi:serine/threonine protein kinase
VAGVFGIMVNLREWLPGHSVAVHKASYQFCEELGKGGFGHVTRARTKDNNGEVAIKKVPKQYVRGMCALSVVRNCGIVG